MSGNYDIVLRTLERISTSNDLKLAYQFIDKPLVSDEMHRLKKEIGKKDQEWFNSVIENLRLFCLIVYLEKKEPINVDIERDYKLLSLNKKIMYNVDGLEHILTLIWRMKNHEVLTSINQFNADRARKREQSKVQRNEQYANVLTNLGNPNDWNEAHPDLVEHFRVNSSKREAQRIIAKNKANENELTKRIWENAPTQAKEYKSNYPTRKALLNALKASKNDLYQPSKKSTRRIRFENEERVEKISGPKHISSTLKQHNNVHTSTLMGNEYVPQIATIKKGGRKLHRKHKTHRARRQ
jgi:hypothetical protein